METMWQGLWYEIITGPLVAIFRDGIYIKDTLDGLGSTYVSQKL